MRRAARRLLLCLVLGVLTTVAIAWALIFEPDRRQLTPRMGTDFPEPRPPEQLPTSTMHWRHIGVDEWSADRIGAFWDFPPARGELPLPADIVPAWAQAELLPWKPTDPPLVQGRRLLAYGWPLRALWCSMELVPHPTATWPYVARNGIVIRDPAPFIAPTLLIPRPLILPTRILWPGFLANTALYSAAWFLLLFAHGIARRALRRHRGQCPRCAYDLRATPPGSPCPECGGTHQRSEPQR